MTTAEAIRECVRVRFGVSVNEFLYGSRLRTNGGRWPAQFSVSLARYTCLYELWGAGVRPYEAAVVMGMTARCVRSWFRDFRRRAVSTGLCKAAADEAKKGAA